MYSDHALRVRVIAGLIGLILIAAVGTVMVDYGSGRFASGYTVTARFAKTAQGLDTTSDVRILGVRVGRVTSIRTERDGHALVSFKIRPGVKIADTASAAIEPISVFGPTYIKIDQGAHGTAGPFVANGGRITATKPFVEIQGTLDKLNTILADTDPAEFATIVSTLANSVTGLGPTFGRIIDNGSTLLNVAVANEPQLKQFIPDLVTASQAFADQSPTIAATVARAGDIAQTVAPHLDRIGQTLDQASRIAGSLSRYLDAHATTFGQFVDWAATAFTFINEHAPDLSALLQLANLTVADISSAVRLAGPGGTLIGALYGSFSSLLCSSLAQPVLQLVSPVVYPVVCGTSKPK
jgi:phospholipid/cholesterol/gamma-HCH transport system substrate-binding protein